MDDKIQQSEALARAPISPAGPLALASDLSVDTLEQRASKSVAFFKALTQLIAKNIRPSEMILYGGKQLHLESTACKRVLEWCGADFIIDEIVQERYKCPVGDAIEFIVKGTVVTVSGGKRPVIGNRSTYDDFFAKEKRKICAKENCGKVVVNRKIQEQGKEARYGDWCEAHGEVTQVLEESIYLPVEEVDIPSVRQAAISNAWNKALGALGVMPALEDLIDAGVKVEDMRNVGFEKGSRGGKVQESDTKAQGDIREKITKLLAEIGRNDRAEMEKTLQFVTAFSDFKGHTQVQRLSHKQLPYALEKLEKMAKEFRAKNPQSGEGSTKPVPANIPKEPLGSAEEVPVGRGVVTEVSGPKQGRAVGNRLRPPVFMDVTQQGKRLVCFENHKMVGGDGADTDVFTLLKSAVGKNCFFFVMSDEKEGKLWHRITGILKIGDQEWENGVPVIQRGATAPPTQREPGDDDLPGNLWPEGEQPPQ